MWLENSIVMLGIYKTLADLFEYPSPSCLAQLQGCKALLPENNAHILVSLDSFSEGVKRLSLSDLQELYTRTFDLNPVCALEIGYHLFGENYKRGVFLANLRETEAPFDLGQEQQLPDFLPVLLRLLTKLDGDGEDLRASLISECMMPAIEKMIGSLKDTDNPYKYLLEAVKQMLRTEVGIDRGDSPAIGIRASLPVLVNESRITTNEYEITRSRELMMPELRTGLGDFVDGRALNLNPNLDLF